MSARQVIVNKKMRTSRLVDFTVSADHWIKMKESETKKKYLTLLKNGKNYGT